MARFKITYEASEERDPEEVEADAYEQDGKHWTFYERRGPGGVRKDPKLSVPLDRVARIERLD